MTLDEDTDRKTVKQVLQEAWDILNESDDWVLPEGSPVHDAVAKVKLKLEQVTSKINAVACDAVAQMDKLR